MDEVIYINGEKHVILEQGGSIFNPKFVGRSTVDGKLHNIKLTRKGLFNHFLDLANQVTLFILGFVLFMLALFI